MLLKAQHGTSLRPLLSIIDTFRHVERLLEECERLLLVFEEPATSIAAESFVLAECPKCDRERALTQDYRLTVNAAEPPAGPAQGPGKGWLPSLGFEVPMSAANDTSHRAACRLTGQFRTRSGRS